MTLKPALLAAACAAAFSGCAQIPMVAKPATLTHSEAQKVAQDGWQMYAPVVKDGSKAFVLHMPVTPPKHIKNKPFSIEMSRPMTVTDVAQVLSRAGIPVIIDDLQSAGGGAAMGGTPPANGAAAGSKRGGMSNPGGSTSGKTVFIPKYVGTVGGFLAAVSKSTDTWITWHDGFVRATPVEEVVVSLPQDPELLKAIKASMGELAAENVTLSLEAGLLTFEVAPSDVPKIRAYLDRVVANAALVTLQVALVSVTSDQSSTQGLDWSSLQLAFGGGGGQASNILNTLSGTATTDSALAATSVVKTDPGAGAYLKGSSLRLAGSLGNFSLIGFVDFMSNYGHARTVQNAMVTTLSSNEVELASVTDVPYVSNVSVGSTNSTSGSLIGSTQTSTAKDGLTLKLKPYYDQASNMVTLPLDVKVQAVLGFKDLSAGNQVGTLTQPTTGTRSLKDTLRMRPGDTMVVGGITFDNVSRTDGLPLFLQPLAGTAAEHQSLKVSRNSLYIIIRPTVRLTPPITEQEGFDIVQEASDAGTPEPKATVPVTTLPAAAPKPRHLEPAAKKPAGEPNRDLATAVPKAVSDTAPAARAPAASAPAVSETVLDASKPGKAVVLSTPVKPATPAKPKVQVVAEPEPDPAGLERASLDKLAPLPAAAHAPAKEEALDATPHVEFHAQPEVQTPAIAPEGSVPKMVEILAAPVAPMGFVEVRDAN